MYREPASACFGASWAQRVGDGKTRTTTEESNTVTRVSPARRVLVENDIRGMLWRRGSQLRADLGSLSQLIGASHRYLVAGGKVPKDLDQVSHYSSPFDVYPLSLTISYSNYESAFGCCSDR